MPEHDQPGAAVRLRGRVAVVTGGTRGIGRAVVERLIAEGASVAFSHYDHPEVAEKLAADLAAEGAGVLTRHADVTRAADCEALMAAAAERFGRLDILVNNAAETDAHRPWHEIDEAQWDHMMAVNAKGPFLCFRAAYPHLRHSPAGRVVNISSVTFHIGQVWLLHYVSSKGALIGFTRTLARELGPEGITVNAVTPGAIQTEMERDLFPGEQERIARDQAAKQSIRRRGTGADIAAAVAYLASDDGGFVTGQTINVDGGWAMP
jgi:3-oxoacyl-[acyl-carrier protein] reductase